jgi:hypothetical protein
MSGAWQCCWDKVIVSEADDTCAERGLEGEKAGEWAAGWRA